MSQTDEAAAAELKKKRTFKKFTYRGVDLDQLLDLNRLVLSTICSTADVLIVLETHIQSFRYILYLNYMSSN